MAKKQVKYTERNGEKFVAKKASWVKTVKMTFLGLSILWLGFGAWYPMHVKNTYSEPIKRSIVVSMFFDLQQGIADQYAALMDGVKGSVDKIKDAVNFDKPINDAVDKIKLVQSTGDDLTKQTNSLKKELDKVSSAMNTAKRFGVNVGNLGQITKGIDDLSNAANKEIQNVNKQLDGVKSTLLKATKEETDKVFNNIDKMVDAEIRGQLDKATGGMSNVLLKKYNVKSIAPWRPSTWGISNQMYAEIEKSSASTVQIIMRTINGYFGYIAWGLVIIAWVLVLFIWLSVFKKVKAVTKPFIVCPNCGHAFSDKRTAMGILKVFQPWKWL